MVARGFPIVILTFMALSFSSVTHATVSFRGLGDLPGGDFKSRALGVSADGSCVVGYSVSTEGDQAFRWENGVMTQLNDLPGTNEDSTAFGVSADGSVIVGAYGHWYLATRWENGTPTVLGDLPGGEIIESWASDVSANGLVVVGGGHSDLGDEAFRWEDNVMIPLGDLPGGSFGSCAYGVSGDGSIVVGRGYTDLGNEVFIWDQINGMRNLKNVLTYDYGLDLTGWSINNVEDISDDGLTIVGNGFNPDGNREAWIATIPEPTALSLLLLGGLRLVKRRKKDFRFPIDGDGDGDIPIQ